MFNLFFFEEVIIMLKEETKGIKINGMSIFCIRFADDIALVSDSEENMNKMILCRTNAF